MQDKERSDDFGVPRGRLDARIAQEAMQVETVLGFVESRFGQ
jgi:hypothetical protein